MKQKAVTLLITVLLAVPLTVNAVAQATPKADEVKARASEALAKKREVVVKLPPGTKILVGEKAFSFEFTKGAGLSGRIKETREKDFTLSSKSGRTGEVTAVISYADVLSIEHPSGFAKALRNIGKYSLIGPVFVAIVPLYAVLAMIGALPNC